jgi:hypothetical protein
MTISSITPKNAGTRSEQASRVKMRKAESGWAERLRERGWAVIDPDHAPSLGVLVAAFAARHAVTVDEAWAAIGMATPDAR